MAGQKETPVPDRLERKRLQNREAQQKYRELHNWRAQVLLKPHVSREPRERADECYGEAD